MHWKYTTLLICIYGIVKEFRPATPFLTPYLVTYKNVTAEEIYGQVYPFWTYSYMIFLIPIFFLTDILRYKPIIILEASCLVGTWVLLVWGEGVAQMQIMQAIFGLSSASEIAYYSYMYAVVDEKNYKMVTSYIRAAAMVGKLLAYGLGQILISTHAGSYLLLNQISLGAVCLVWFIALFLPSIKPEIKPNGSSNNLAASENEPNEADITRGQVERRKLQNGLRVYFINTLRNFSIYKKNKVVLKWSIWWALTSCGIYQVYNYMQTLWLEMQSDPSDVNNGIAEFAHTALGAVLSFVIQYLSINWKRYGEVTLCVSSFLIAGILAYLSQTSHIVIGYVGYVICTGIYNMLITAASANIATELTNANYGLVFGWNTFVAVLLQTILTITVADSHGFNLPIREQFEVYSGFFACVGVVFLVFVMIRWVSVCFCTRRRSLSVE
ncbi:unnamed protein product [Auanema sp. JU1783]|nr:unnamed protein product [Auanema sp. JU1783]